MDVRSIAREHLDLAVLRKRQGHKYDHGHALVLSGGAGRSGAALLAARGALRIGAGAVTLGVPPAAQLEVATQIRALMLARVADAAALEAILEDERINILCLGPGFGLGERQGALLASALRSGRGLVIDADALTLLARDAALFGWLHPGCVLTPHGGEFARLFPDLATALEAGMGRAEAAGKAAARAGAWVILKGSETCVAGPDGAIARHRATGERAAPWLATAGAGDVLAGFVTGLRARGLAPRQAAELAVWLHVECALDFGAGLIAEDLPERLPRVMNRLGI
ncbi:NAD(P)H-hydrate dehydratase [Sulfitobacter aestuarii]|uniref:ADP-dependent (S)-NAD(P)H-hydrate dehydratase n=1 Tax=Sulfitobacter aestuarii TaxID=2161676 RepID=A0ABW5TYT9_9RHOB